MVVYYKKFGPQIKFRWGELEFLLMLLQKSKLLLIENIQPFKSSSSISALHAWGACKLQLPFIIISTPVVKFHLMQIF